MQETEPVVVEPKVLEPIQPTVTNIVVSSPAYRPNRREVQRTFRLDMIGACLYSAFGILIVSFPAVLARRQGAADWIVSLVIAAPSIGQLSTILWSRYTQKSRKMRVMFWGGGAARLSLLLMLFAFHPIIFALVMIVCNTLEMSKSPAYASIMQQVYPAERRGELMGKVRVISSVATMIAAVVLGAVLEQFSYQIVFPIVGLIGFASIVVFSRVRYRDEPLNRPPTSLRRLIMIPRTDKRYGSFLHAVFWMGFFNLLGSAVFPMVMVDDLHVSNGFVGIINGLQSLVAILFYFIWGRFSDRHHPMVLLYITFLISLSVIAIYTVAWTGWLLLIIAILTGISAAGSDLATINNAIRFPKDAKDIPHYMALYSSLIGVRGVITPFMAAGMLGFMSDRAVLVIAFVGMSGACLNFYRVQKKLMADPDFADPLAVLPTISSTPAKKRLLRVILHRS